MARSTYDRCAAVLQPCIKLPVCVPSKQGHWSHQMCGLVTQVAGTPSKESTNRERHPLEVRWGFVVRSLSLVLEMFVVVGKHLVDNYVDGNWLEWLKPWLWFWSSNSPTEVSSSRRKAARLIFLLLPRSAGITSSALSIELRGNYNVRYTKCSNSNAYTDSIVAYPESWQSSNC